MSSEPLGIIPTNFSPPSRSIHLDRRWGYPAAVATSARLPPPPPLSSSAQASAPSRSQPPSYFIPAYPNVTAPPTSSLPGFPTPSTWPIAPALHPSPIMSGNHYVYNMMPPWPYPGAPPGPSGGGGGGGGGGDKKKKDADGDDKKEGGGEGKASGGGKGSCTLDGFLSDTPHRYIPPIYVHRWRRKEIDHTHELPLWRTQCPYSVRPSRYTRQCSPLHPGPGTNA